ncbi:MAG: hypothetical protein QOJ19_4871 [Acidimicrobiia bacterium]|jgi:hypothetical protein|nr:hypothetical protein [Acidimicrobiia bacterium]
MVSPRHQRPLDLSPIETHQLPITPPADRNIPAEAWSEAPPDLLTLGEDFGEPTVLYLRQIGPFLVWRAGTGTARAESRWMALDLGDLARRFTFHQRPDGTGEGDGPNGPHTRFRTWKEDLNNSR